MELRNRPRCSSSSSFDISDFESDKRRKEIRHELKREHPFVTLTRSVKSARFAVEDLVIVLLHQEVSKTGSEEARSCSSNLLNWEEHRGLHNINPDSVNSD